MPDLSNLLSALRDCYQEHLNQARHHESQRERMSALVVAVTTALVSVTSQGAFALRTLPLALLLIPLGAFGLAFSRKHYERNRLHTTIARHYLRAIGGELAAPSPSIVGTLLEDIHKAGRKDHKEKFGTRDDRHASLTAWRLHTFWNGLHVLIVILGGVLAGCIMWLHHDQLGQLIGVSALKWG
jgi:hypothetical protein